MKNDSIPQQLTQQSFAGYFSDYMFIFYRKNNLTIQPSINSGFQFLSFIYSKGRWGLYATMKYLLWFLKKVLKNPARFS